MNGTESNMASIERQLEQLRQVVASQPAVNRTEIMYVRQDMELRFAKVDAALERLSEAIEDRGTTCPHRETVIRAANHVAELRLVRERLQAIELQLAQNPMIGGAAGGGLVGILAMIGYGLGKMAGWW